MANLFLETTTYITEAELKASTRITDAELVGTDTAPSTTHADTRNILIRKAEVILDSLIWSYGTKVSPSQTTVFPVVTEGTPIAIKKAVVLLCEGMFLGGELQQSQAYTGAKFVKSETHWPDKIEFQQESVQANGLSRKNQYVSQEIETLIKPFLSVSSGVRWSKAV